MNIQDYIASGILEAYVTGSLSEAEMREVEAMATAHPEVRGEIDAIALAMERYAMAHAKKPSDRLLSNILSQIEAEDPASEPISAAKPTIVKEMRFRRLSLAASILLFISLAGNIYYYGYSKRVSTELAELQARNYQMASETETLKAGYNKLSGDMAILLDKNTRSYTLAGVATHPDASAVLAWNQQTGAVVLLSTNLPEPAADKQYQLWALIDGQPVDAGVFDTAAGLQHMKNFTRANAFAVTLEPKGGSVSPTLDQMYVMAGV